MGPQAALVVLVVCSLLSPGLGQNVRMGRCDTFQGDRSFDVQYIHTLTDAIDGYYLVLTTGQPRSCQRIIFQPGGTYVYSFIDEFQVTRNYTGAYTAGASTFTTQGFIELSGLSVGELGADLYGTVRMAVMIADDEQLVVISCVPLGVISVEQVHGLIPATKFTSNSALDLSTYLIGQSFPNRERFTEISQTCIPNLRQSTPSFDQLLKVYNFLVKLGIVPALPFRGDGIIRNVDVQNVLETEINNANIPPSALQALVNAADAPVNSLQSPTAPSSSAFFRVSPMPSVRNPLRSDVPYSVPSNGLSGVQSLPPLVYTQPIRRTNPAMAYPRYSPQAFVKTGNAGSQIYTRLYV